MKIGVVGLGVVGGTIFHAMKFFHEEVVGFDKFKTSDSFEDICDTDLVFVAVPSNGHNGRLNCSSIHETLELLEKASYSGIVCIKSTIRLDFLDDAKKFNLRIAYVPEFLHEKTRLADFLSPDHVVISAKKEDVDTVRQAFYWVSDDKFYFVDDRTAEIAKLALNAFAATKISFANEIKRICDEVGADSEKIMEILRSDKRCAPEYTKPTGNPYGGKCLPKDTRELMGCSSKSILLRAVEEVNEQIKKEKKLN